MCKEHEEIINRKMKKHKGITFYEQAVYPRITKANTPEKMFNLYIN